MSYNKTHRDRQTATPHSRSRFMNYWKADLVSDPLSNISALWYTSFDIMVHYGVIVAHSGLLFN